MPTMVVLKIEQILFSFSFETKNWILKERLSRFIEADNWKTKACTLIDY